MQHDDDKMKVLLRDRRQLDGTATARSLPGPTSDRWSSKHTETFFVCEDDPQTRLENTYDRKQKSEDSTY